MVLDLVDYWLDWRSLCLTILVGWDILICALTVFDLMDLSLD